MFFMLGSTIILSCMHGLIRVVADDLHPLEVTFFRNLFGLLAVLPVIARQGISSLRTARPGLVLLRTLSGIVAMTTWFTALTILPLAEAVALSFLSVIFASIGASLVLKERMRLRRWTAIAIGFVGALIILRPGFREFNLGMLMVLVATLTWGTNVVIVKILVRTDSLTSIVGIMAISFTVLSFPLALLVWETPTSTQLLLLVAIGILGTIGHFGMTKALSVAEAGAVMPLDFTRLIWASLIGIWLFGEYPGVWTVVGGGVIICSATYVIWRESGRI